MAKQEDIVVYNIPDQHRGDTFPGLNFTASLKGGGVKDLTNVSINVHFNLNGKLGATKKTLTVGAGVTIVDAVNGLFKIDKFNWDMEAGTYYYGVEFVENGDTDTWAEGKVLLIQDVRNSKK